MEITYLGHSCFLIEDSKNRKLLTDPFDNTVGYSVFEDECNIVTISHHHFDHDYTKDIKGDPKIIDKIGNFYVDDVEIMGISSYHDKVKGAKRGENTIYVFKMDGFTLCHLGDLGYVLSREEVSSIGDVDVLFVPVGGNFTIDGKEAAAVTKLIAPHYVIPMHYKTQHLSFELDGVENFIKSMGAGEKVGSNILNFSQHISEKNIVKIMEYKK